MLPNPLTPTQQTALAAFIANHSPRTWKANLRKAWERSGGYGVTPDCVAVLQSMRNTLGPTWLSTYRVTLDACPHCGRTDGGHDAGFSCDEAPAPAAELLCPWTCADECSMARERAGHEPEPCQAHAEVALEAARALLDVWAIPGLDPRVGDVLTPDAVEALLALRKAVRHA